MNTILLAHAARYPLMEPTDAVKLIYQNEFGGGHLIKDTSACLNFLQREYDATPQKPNSPLTEEIGNGLVRVNLAALNHSGLSVAELGDAFLQSAAQYHGSRDSFLRKLSILAEMTRNGKMPFSSDALQAYLEEYEKAGFPPVSHSELYRNTYCPTYRVVLKDHLPKQVL